MDDNNFFWKIHRGELTAPNIAKTLNIEFLEVDPEHQSLTTRFSIDDRFNNPAGHVQGGILAAMLDDTMGPALAMLLGENEFAPTLNLNVSFIKSAKPGYFTGKARVVNKGRSICFLTGELFDANEALVATASATAKINALPNHGA